MDRNSQLRPSKFFRQTLAQGNPERIQEMLDVLARNRKVVEEDIATLVYYMNGGLDYNDAWLLTNDQRKIMGHVIERHFKATNPSSKSQL
jgi:hypothetical protein